MDKISKEELAFFRKHPELVQTLGSKKTIYKTVLVVVFVTGFFLVAISKILKFGFADAANQKLVEFIVDLIFELGVALWGGVATTVLLQDLVKRQYSEGRRYQQEIMKQLEKAED
jgi:hypothetical protein